MPFSVTRRPDKISLMRLMHSSSPLTAALATLLALTVSPAVARGGNETMKWIPSDGEPLDWCGHSSAISGTTAIVGAYRKQNEWGAAYLFDSTTGEEIAKLLPDDGGVNARFGYSVAISGNTAIVGAPNDAINGPFSGAAYLFDAMTGLQLARLDPLDGALGDRFGWSVAISGTTAIVGSIRHRPTSPGPDTGAAYLFDTTTGQQVGKLVANDGESGDDFGSGVGISGSIAIVGARGDDDLGNNAGAAYLFHASGSEIEKLLLSDGGSLSEIGTAVAISGSTAVVGNISGSNNGVFPGSAFLFDAVTGDEIAKLVASDGVQGDRFGWSVDISETAVIVGARYHDLEHGAAYVFDSTTGAEVAKLTPSDPLNNGWLGESVGISGATAIAGAPESMTPVSKTGAVYVYRFDVVSYCTSGTSASGCEATLSATGTPSALAESGFTLTASGVEGAKDGLYFFGTNGKQANSWGNGTSYQCVVPPVKRCGLLAGTGAIGACDGLVSQDLNALWCPTCPKPGHNPGVGATVQAQLWYRDPLSTSNQTTSLSDAIEFVLAP